MATSTSQDTPLSASERSELEKIVGKDNVLTADDEMLSYDCDATTLEKLPPKAVVFVHSTEEVQGVVRWCNRTDTPFIARGAGTGLSGGALALSGGVIIELARMNRILEIDVESRIAIVEPGVVNLHISNAVRADGCFFAPDPSSQPSCTIGGNVAENSGGPHTLKYGVTTNHVLGLEVVLPDGDVVEFGGDVRGQPGYNLTGLFIGSEGTFGIATKIVVRLMRLPEATKTLLASFGSVRDAAQTVSDITMAGMIPSALEMIDGFICRAVENHLHVGLPLDAEAVLLIELDGAGAGMEALAERITDIAKRNNAQAVRVAKDGKERAALWRARKGAFGAIGLVSPSYYVHDGVIPRSKIADVLEQIAAIGEEYGLRICNVFHAGDGNLHPLVLFDDRNPEHLAKVHKAGEKILRACVDAGGSLTGEHGIGFEKIGAMSWLFDDTSLDLMVKIREVFNPKGLSNPGKAVPTPGQCVETKMIYGSVRNA